MGRITSSGCARKDRITRDEVECDLVDPGAATRSDQVTKLMMFLLYTNIKLTTTNSILTIILRNGEIDTM